MSITGATRDAHLTEEIGELLFKVMRSMRGHIHTAANSAQLTPQQTFLLHLLQEPRAMSSVAEMLHCDASNVTGLADRLESRGLVERRHDPDDRRVRQLALTPEGKRLIEELNRTIWTNSPVGTALSAGDQRTLRDLLRKALGEAG